MALEYTLTLAGTTSAEEVARRAFPEPDQRPVPDDGVLTADLYDRFGFFVTVHAGQDAYLAVRGDQGWWTWRPDNYVSISFEMDKSADLEWEVDNMTGVVSRLLDTGPEDAILVLNSDIQLFTRFDGVLVKHNRDGWWASHAGADGIIRG